MSSEFDTNLVFDDVSMLQQAARTMADNAQSLRQGIPVHPSQPPVRSSMEAPPMSTVAPPSAPVLSKDDLAMAQYNEEKKKLERIHQQLLNLSHADKCGEIIRNFGLAQLILRVGDTTDRTNGLILLRALKTNNKIKEQQKTGKETMSTTLSVNDNVVTYLYEVWGFMEDESIGLTACYSPDIIFYILNLKSGLDMPPGLDDEG